ncbi:hypothetical protein A2153_03905 [Candidatus Gottesmanbacteria bacterium RBG_16_38_7b]|uniref:Dephospho-CoA kinase n=1 Tax=Candidatus Gottesmanbacteria bacterium RBG_16_38_7b TaxID=1798372 RepID=A0A1F5YFB6_9BACT|nr:MAG: hypothetical protein A2153_03905 [Candidatus Gottesmanbacteria bacterium RBG_16_38_7b]
MVKSVAVLVGLPGTGKTLAAQFFINNKFPVVRMGDLTHKHLKINKLSPSEKNEHQVREKLRQNLGQDIYARSIIDKVKYLLKTHDLVIIEGMRSCQEWQFFQKNLKKVKMIYLQSDRKKRIKRLMNRLPRTLTLSEIEHREKYEIEKLNHPRLKQLADFVVINNTDIQNFIHDLSIICKQCQV